MTLIPLALALRNAVEMPSLFSHAAAIASTPEVIQFSMISFCLAGSGSVGPSKINSMPSSFAASSAPCLQEIKYALPLLLGMSAMASFFPLLEVADDSEDCLQPVKARLATARSAKGFVMRFD